MIREVLISLGAYAGMCREVLRDVCKGGVNLRELIKQITMIGWNSMPIVLITALFSGMVIALQTAYGLQRFGAKNYVGNIVGLSLVRELGPVLTAVMLCGRVGAGITAEIASMVASEQVDALRALGANPIRKLVSPRVIAGLIVLPLLVVIADVVGIYGGMLVAIFEFNLSAYQYQRGILYTLFIGDIFDGLIKSAFFAFLFITIACYKGLSTKGGTEGVGLSTTESVVTGSIVVFISDFFITKILIIIQSL